MVIVLFILVLLTGCQNNDVFNKKIDVSKYNVNFYEQLLLDKNNIKSREYGLDSVNREKNINTLYLTNYSEDLNLDGKSDDVYYFSGNSLDNWVKFGKNKSGNELYWRIIRINEDNSVRMLYSGTSPATQEAYIDKSTYSYVSYKIVKLDDGDSRKEATGNLNPYMGYMYGDGVTLEDSRKNTNDSNVKEIIDNWYKGSLLKKKDNNGNVYDKYISRTAIYCNDRSVHHIDKYNDIYFNGYDRIFYFDSSYYCGNHLTGEKFIEDNFTAKNENGIGNQLLDYPVGLMSIDEISFAGSTRWNDDAEAWYYNNSDNLSITGDIDWITMSPSMYDGYSSPSIYAVNSVKEQSCSNCKYIAPGMIIEGSSYFNEYAIRPVISIKSCVKYMDGTGTVENPYELIIDEQCIEEDN